MKCLHQAFTLIEVLITLFLITILAAVSVPSLQVFFSSANDELVQQQITSAIMLAQQEARARYAEVGVCPSQDASTCSKAWSGNLLIFSEEEGGLIHDSTQIIHVLPLSIKTGQLYWRAFPRYASYLSFMPTGLLRYINGTFWYYQTNSVKPLWLIKVNQSGQTHIENLHRQSG